MDRVRVGVRCRPPFEDELDADGLFTSAVSLDTPVSSSSSSSPSARVEIRFPDETMRDFGFDWSFG